MTSNQRTGDVRVSKYQSEQLMASIRETRRMQMLEIRNMTCGYGRKAVLRDIDLGVSRGEFIGVIGPNGSGKTTLLRAMTRVIKPQKGAVLFEGRDIASFAFKELAEKVAVVSQSPESGVMTAEEFVLLGRIPHNGPFQLFETKKDIEIAWKCMELTDTLKLKDCLMSRISGGERQLVLIARALAQEPKLLLLDEPTSHLDIAHQVRIMDLIKRLNGGLDLTVVVVLHDLNLASEYCRRLVLVNEGRIHRYGTPFEILDERTIKEVYKTDVTIKKNPISSRPYMLLSSRRGKGKEAKR
jgi:iron complex transport system ATP-binding protein